LSRFDSAPPVRLLSQESLVDFPLRLDETSASLPVTRDSQEQSEFGARAAGLGVRAAALAADAAMILLLGTAVVLGAGVVTGELPSSGGIPWIGGFGLLLSFFTTVAPLILFGRTVGMALAGLTSRRAAGSRRLRPHEAVRRWLGTLATVATLGAVLLFTARSSETLTPADRWSRRSLEESDEG